MKTRIPENWENLRVFTQTNKNRKIITQTRLEPEKWYLNSTWTQLLLPDYVTSHKLRSAIKNMVFLAQYELFEFSIFLLCQTFNLLIKFFKYSVTVTYLCTICMAIKNTLPDLSSWVVNQPHKVMSLESKKLKKYYIW